MALVSIDRFNTSGAVLADFQISPELLNEEAWIKKVYVSGSANKPLLIYKNPAVFYGGGIYEFFDPATGYYSSIGSDKLTVMSGFRYKWVTYWALDAEGLGGCGFNAQAIRDLFSITSYSNLEVNDLINLGLGTFFTSTAIPFGNSVNQAFNYDAFPEITPADSVMNRYPYVIELFSELQEIGVYNKRLNNAIWAPQIGTANSTNGFIGGYFKSAETLLTLIARQFYIINENVPNLCPRPFRCFVTKGRIPALDPSGLGNQVTMFNINYLGVEPT